MNKFLAILKDSYYEAVSTWVLQVMLVLSLLLMVFVASVSFRQISLEDELTHSNNFNLLNFAARSNPNVGNARYGFENVQATNAAEPWKSDYSFDLIISADSPEGLKKAREQNLPMGRSEMRQILKEELYFLDNLKIEEMKPADEKTQKDVRYHVTTTGTKTPDRLSWRHEPTIFFAWTIPELNSSLREGVYTMEKRLINDVGAWATLLVTIIVTAGFIPSLLRKGYLDLYISKPIGWVELLIYKYLGGLLFVFIITTFTVLGIWTIIGLRTGIWSSQFLLLVPMLVFYFAVLYSVSTFVAVLTRSGMLAILATVIVWGLSFGFGFFYDKVKQAERAVAELSERLKDVRKNPDQDPDDMPENLRSAREFADWAKVLAKTGHAILPRTYDLDDQMIHMIADGLLTEAELKKKGLDRPLPSAAATFGASTAFIILMLGLACWRFATRDG